MRQSWAVGRGYLEPSWRHLWHSCRPWWLASAVFEAWERGPIVCHEGSWPRERGSIIFCYTGSCLRDFGSIVSFTRDRGLGSAGPSCFTRDRGLGNLSSLFFCARDRGFGTVATSFFRGVRREGVGALRRLKNPARQPFIVLHSTIAQAQWRIARALAPESKHRCFVFSGIVF